MSVSPEQKEMLIHYGELKTIIKEKTKDLEVIKIPVRELLIELGAEDTPVETGNGKFTLQPRRTWTYSDETELLMKQVKAKQKFEESTGLAKFDTLYDVYFK